MAQSAASTCEICTAGPGEYYCQQCDQLFCGSCKLSHLRAKSCKNHTFVSGRIINQAEKILCIEHKESFLFYCQECDTPVCRISSVEKHSRHLMTDITKLTKKLRSGLLKNIESEQASAQLNLDRIEKGTKDYREEVKAVIQTIIEDGNYLKKLIDKKVDNLVKHVQIEEQTTLQNMSALTKMIRVDFENCKQWQKDIKEMETRADVLLLRKLKQIKDDIDYKDPSTLPERPSISYRNKKRSGTEINNLFGDFQLRGGCMFLENTENQPFPRPLAVQKRYRYACQFCRKEQVSIEEPGTYCMTGDQGIRIECNNSKCSEYKRPTCHMYKGEA